MASVPYFESVKMTMHIDEAVLEEVMKITGTDKKTKAVALALKEMTRRARLRAALGRGSGVPPEQLPAAYDFDSSALFQAAEDPAPYGKRRTRR
jgi:Arc/MetJ family transcription regulator